MVFLVNFSKKEKEKKKINIISRKCVNLNLLQWLAERKRNNKC